MSTAAKGSAHESERLLKSAADSIVSALKRVDEKIETHVGENVKHHGLQLMPGFSTVLRYKSFVRDSLGITTRSTPYDYFPVLISELGVIRSIRYSGRVHNISSRDSFIIQEMKRCKGEGTRIAEELPGTFVTLGRLENRELSELQACIGALMGLIRPYAKILSHEQRVVLPTPLSLSAYVLNLGGTERRAWLSPSSITVHLYSGKITKTRSDILGRSIDCAIVGGNFISAEPHGEHVTYREIGRFPIVFPLTSDFREEVGPILDSLRSRDVLVHLIGIFVFVLAPYLPNRTDSLNNGFFLALSEAPIPLEVEVAAVLGQPWKITLGSISLGGKSLAREFFPALSIESAETFKNALKNFLNTLQNIRSRTNAENLIQSQTLGVFLTSLDRLFCDRGNQKYYLSPPYITMTLLEKIKANDIYNVIFDLEQKARARIVDLELLSARSRDEIYKKVLNLKTHTCVWAEAHEDHIDIARRYELGYVM